MVPIPTKLSKILKQKLRPKWRVAVAASAVDVATSAVTIVTSAMAVSTSVVTIATSAIIIEAPDIAVAILDNVLLQSQNGDGPFSAKKLSSSTTKLDRPGSQSWAVYGGWPHPQGIQKQLS